MKSKIQDFSKIIKGIFIFSIFTFVFSSCSQRIAGNYRTSQMEIQQAMAQTSPEINTTIDEEETVQLTKPTQQENTAELSVATNEVNNNPPVMTKRQAKKMIKERIAQSGKTKSEKLKEATIKALPLLAFNKSGNTKSAKKPMRDFLVLGIVLLVIGIVVGIFGGIFGVVGSILAVIGLVLIILYIVQVAL